MVRTVYANLSTSSSAGKTAFNTVIDGDLSAEGEGVGVIATANVDDVSIVVAANIIVTIKMCLNILIRLDGSWLFPLTFVLSLTSFTSLVGGSTDLFVSIVYLLFPADVCVSLRLFLNPSLSSPLNVLKSL